MDDTGSKKGDTGASWLLYMFQLPARMASKRVSVWRKLQKYGALSWKNCAYILPLDATNLERFQWLAAEVQKYQGEASVVEVPLIHGYTHRQVMVLFNNARATQYQGLIRDSRLALRASATRSHAQQLLDFSRLNRRLNDLNAIDFFGCGKRRDAERLIKELEIRASGKRPNSRGNKARTEEYRARVWQTRPRPEVDRVGSAWLIRNFIDPRAKFVFSRDPEACPGALRFDMFGGEFTHAGDECTFEVLVKHFKLRDRSLEQIGQLVHDADLRDAKFGRPEGIAIEIITKGWGKMDLSDEEILRRGFELFDALYLMVGT
ncbi:MAG TPA: chromate resistance protein ChrB domain-containing protein [Terriglobia bacterium]|nr:chromate resistance protein ChrB domain-containing protein [Terriglobia bacterium]